MVPAAALLEASLDVAHRIARNPTHAVRAIKQLVARGRDGNREELLQLEASPAEGSVAPSGPASTMRAGLE